MTCWLVKRASAGAAVFTPLTMVVGILGFLVVAATSWLKNKMLLKKEVVTTGGNGMEEQNVKCVDLAVVETVQILSAGLLVNGVTAVTIRA
ncbi:hypothetical protein HU718_016595 [Pseudomonas tensinigenes]|uniref:Uncharacterized protein n=1 Tax=Pseudomonas tensinigenes TaxID=2745511 RepID=A0ABX8PQV1_9PSED|nr:hypothetical protein [Pseudomonas tensinigenes]QXI03656.1 hypothetical protein HU718_016595 [Pseudomonas tensinigenes]